MGRHIDAVDLLISLDANVNGVIEHSSILHYACTIGGIGGEASKAFAVQCIEKLIFAGARIDALDEFDRTPLHIAAASNLSESILLLSFVTDATVDTSTSNQKSVLNHQDNRGQTALHIAARSGNHETLSQLMKHGSNKEIQDHRGRTACHHSAEIADENGMKICMTEITDGLGRTASFVLDSIKEHQQQGQSKRLPTLIVYPHQATEHKTAVSIARGRGDPPPENEQRIHVLVNEKIGTLRATEFNKRVIWDESSPRASIADILRVHDHLYVNMIKSRCEGKQTIMNDFV
jgi:hypothetical protein